MDAAGTQNFHPFFMVGTKSSLILEGMLSDFPGLHAQATTRLVLKPFFMVGTKSSLILEAMLSNFLYCTHKHNHALAHNQ